SKVTILVSIISILATVLSAKYLENKYSTIEFACLFMLVTFLLSTILYFRKYNIANKRFQDMVDSLSQFEKDADQRYQELQSSKSLLEINYQEGKILESISKEIQKTDENDFSS